MIWLAWVLALASIGVALVALWVARGVGWRLRLMNQAYWELRYEHSSLKARVDRLAPESADSQPKAPPPVTDEVGFVPLGTLKRRD